MRSTLVTLNGRFCLGVVLVLCFVAESIFFNYSVAAVPKPIRELRRDQYLKTIEATQKVPRLLHLKEKALTTFASATAAFSLGIHKFRSQSGPIQGLEAIAALWFIQTIWHTKLFGIIDYAWLCYQWFLPPEQQHETYSRVRIFSELNTHYLSTKEDHKLNLVLSLVKAIPAVDLKVIDSEFLILNIDTKLSRYCENLGLSEVELASATNPKGHDDEFNENDLAVFADLFIHRVLHYRSGNEPDEELKQEVAMRKRDHENKVCTKKKAFLTAEEYCNYIRWQGKQCLVSMEVTSGYKTGVSEESEWHNGAALLRAASKHKHHWLDFDFF